ATLPAARGLLPGAGVMVNAVVTCTSKNPIKVFGKPEPYGIKLILKDTKFSSEQAGIFGDRLNTDILAGSRANIKTIAVLTGVTTKEMVKELRKNYTSLSPDDKDLIPDLVINTLDEIFKI
ncbi:MAG: HAD hydrolase-like protein, partial [Promethearchaeota archaeon]